MTPVNQPASIYDRDLTAELTGKYLAVAQQLPANASVLELGCASGYFAAALRARGHSVIGLEADAEAVKRCAERGVEAYQADLSSPAGLAVLGERRFDAILSMDVFEHLPYPAEIVVALEKYLKPGGALIVTGPNVAYWWVRLMLLRGRWETQGSGIMDHTHLRWFTRSGWRALLESRSLRVQVDEVAEAMLPLDSKLRRWSEGLHHVCSRFAVRFFPNWVAVVFLLVARARVDGDSR